MSKPQSTKKVPWHLTPEGRETATRWRRSTAEAKRERVFELLGEKCVDCGLDDRVAVKVRQAVDDPIVPVSVLWRSSMGTFNDLLSRPDFTLQYHLICNPCRSKRIMATHKHGDPALARKCSCPECKAYRTERTALYVKRAALRKARDRVLVLEREIAEHEQRVEQRSRHAS